MRPQQTLTGVNHTAIHHPYRTQRVRVKVGGPTTRGNRTRFAVTVLTKGLQKKKKCITKPFKTSSKQPSPNPSENARKRVQFWGVVLTKIPRARFRNASKIIEINIGVFQNRDVTKTRGNGEQIWVVVLTKIPVLDLETFQKYLLCTGAWVLSSTM